MSLYSTVLLLPMIEDILVNAACDPGPSPHFTELVTAFFVYQQHFRFVKCEKHYLTFIV